MSDKQIFDTIIIGGGPAGLAAAIYTGRDRFSTLILEEMNTGGQMFTTSDIENYPGFEAISGPELTETMEKHAKKFGAQIEIMAKVTGFKKGDDGIFEIAGGEKPLYARTILIATGAKWNKLGIEGEEEFRGRGVSYCATCDGAFFRDKHLIVIGGGNTALDEGLFLTKFASKVTLVHRRDQLRGDKILQEKFLAHEKTDIIWDSIPKAIKGTNKVEKVLLFNKKTEEYSDVEADGVFIFVGTTANTDFLKELVELDQWGGIVISGKMETSEKGCFAAGDCIADSPRQIAVAVGDGVRAALSIKHHLEKNS